MEGLRSKKPNEILSLSFLWSNSDSFSCGNCNLNQISLEVIFLLKSNLPRIESWNRRELIAFHFLRFVSDSALFSCRLRFTPRYTLLRRKFYTHETRKRDHVTRAGISLTLWVSSHPQVVPRRSFIIFQSRALLCVPLDNRDLGIGTSSYILLILLSFSRENVKWYNFDINCKIRKFTIIRDTNDTSYIQTDAC